MKTITNYIKEQLDNAYDDFVECIQNYSYLNKKEIDEIIAFIPQSLTKDSIFMYYDDLSNKMYKYIENENNFDNYKEIDLADGQKINLYSNNDICYVDQPMGSIILFNKNFKFKKNK